MENKFACNVTVFQVDLIEVEGARARSDRIGLESLLYARPGAFYLRGQGPSICVSKGLLSACQGAFYLRVKGLLITWPGAFYLRVKGPSICVSRGLLSAWLGSSTCVSRGQDVKKEV